MSGVAPIHSIPSVRIKLNSPEPERPKRTYRGRPKGRPPGQALPIANKKLLRRLVADAIDETFGGSVRAASRASHLPESFLHTIIANGKKEIDPDNYDKLHALIPKPKHAKLWRAFVPKF